MQNRESFKRSVSVFFNSNENFSNNFSNFGCGIIVWLLVYC